MNRLYVFGGKDIGGLGHLNNLWSLDISELEDFEPGKSEYLTNPEWVQVETKGQNIPRPISNHSSVVYEGFMYLFGGSNGNADNETLYKLDMDKYVWTVVKPTYLENDKSRNNPLARDEHSCCMYGDSMVIFGGFARGEKCNEIF